MTQSSNFQNAISINSGLKMTEPTTNQEKISEFRADSSVEIFSQIEQVAVTTCPEETSAILKEDGVVLLAITANREDDPSFPFRFVVGLNRGSKISPYLSNFFKH